MKRNLEIVEETTTNGGRRYFNKLTKTPVGTIRKSYDEEGIMWIVRSFDDFMGQDKSFRSLQAAKYYLSAFAIEAWEQETAEMRILA